MQIQLLDYVTNEGSNAEGAEALDVRHRREVFPHVRSQLDRVENDNSFRFPNQGCSSPSRRKYLSLAVQTPISRQIRTSEVSQVTQV